MTIEFNVEQRIGGWYVLLWSQSQNGFHIEPVRAMLSSNRRAYADDRRMDYVPIFFGTLDSCSGMADCLRNTVRQRAIQRQARAMGDQLERRGTTC